VQWCPDGEFLAIFLHLVFSASRVQHVSTCILVLLRPSSFHCHCGGWLPSNHHRHCGVVQYYQWSFRRSFLKTAITIPQSSYSHLNAASFDSTRRVCDTAYPPPCGSASALANDTSASTFSVASQTAFVCSCRDAPSTVLNESVVTVSLSTAPGPSTVR